MDSIVTVGISPCWDLTCKADGLDWGMHEKLSSQHKKCAGKALNISRALAWLGAKNTAAGLWGQSDYQQMLENVTELCKFVDIKFTAVPGATRENVTVIDTKTNREMHLRATSKLASKESLQKLHAEIEEIVGSNNTVVFAGSFPSDALLEDCVSIINDLAAKGSNIAVDTSGKALKRIVESGSANLIKPNLEELCELLGHPVTDDPVSITTAARTLCGMVEHVLVSRGVKGAVLVTSNSAYIAAIKSNVQKPTSTVACGDYLLAGFLAARQEDHDLPTALEKGIKVATARALGLTETSTWAETSNKFSVKSKEINTA